MERRGGERRFLVFAFILPNLHFQIDANIFLRKLTETMKKTILKIELKPHKFRETETNGLENKNRFKCFLKTGRQLKYHRNVNGSPLPLKKKPKRRRRSAADPRAREARKTETVVTLDHMPT